jgi:hypothetical protein
MPFFGKASALAITGMEKDRLGHLARIAIAEFAAGRTPIIAVAGGDAHNMARAFHREVPVHCSIAALRKEPRCIFVLDADIHSEGLRLHDKSGEHPRSLILGMVPSAGGALQLQGRVSRRNSASESKIILPFDPVHDEKDVVGFLTSASIALTMGDEAPEVALAVAKKLPGSYPKTGKEMATLLVGKSNLPSNSTSKKDCIAPAIPVR